MDNYSLSQDVLSSWERLSHTLLVGTLAYGGLILWLRVSGKRTLSKWNSFDFVVTIAFGVYPSQRSANHRCLPHTGNGCHWLVSHISVYPDLAISTI